MLRKIMFHRGWGLVAGDWLLFNDFMFKIISKDKNSNGRIGKIDLPHGKVDTPVFMPVGTYGAVKTLSPIELEESGVEIILTNAYHLYLKPGEGLIEKAGGLNSFMNWPKPVLTDSGGFQVFSLSKNLIIKEDGVEFQSPIDGSKHFFTPELAMEVQGKLDSDIAMVLDEPCSYPCTREKAVESLKRTADWAKKSKLASKKGQKVFGIIQGSTYPDLRKESLDQITTIGFDGYALGGFSVGEPLSKMFEQVKEIAPLLPEDKPRYLMGVGDPLSLVKCISYGIDMFDSVLPTRMARNGAVFTSEGKINIKNARFKEDLNQLDKECTCYCCRNFSRAYLRFTYLNNEILAHRLLSWHNVSYIISIVKNAKKALKKGNIMELENKMKEVY